MEPAAHRARRRGLEGAGEDGYFLLTLTAGEELGQAGDRGMDYVFVLDISGSMNDDGKLGLSRGSLEAFVERTGENDRFELMTFNVSGQNLFRDLRAADEAAREDSGGAFWDSQQAKGGTFLEPAISQRPTTTRIPTGR